MTDTSRTVFFAFDFQDPQDQIWIERIMAYKRSRAIGVPQELVRRVSRTKVGRDFVIPLATALAADQEYTAKELATILGDGWNTRRVVSKLNILGRPETRYGTRIFERPSAGHYSLTVAMKEAISQSAHDSAAK